MGGIGPELATARIPPLITYIVIGVCFVLVGALLDITFLFWKSCGFTHTVLLVCFDRRVGEQGTGRSSKNLYDFDAAEQRYLMTQRSRDQRVETAGEHQPALLSTSAAAATNLALQITPNPYALFLF